MISELLPSAYTKIENKIVVKIPVTYPTSSVVGTDKSLKHGMFLITVTDLKSWNPSVFFKIYRQKSGFLVYFGK